MQETTKLGYFKECRDQTVSAERGLARARSFLEISQEQVALASFYFLRRPDAKTDQKFAMRRSAIWSPDEALVY